ncbi:MAG: hypothetical protein WKF47_14345, partial [Geodermatophilaceae bacterium]
MTEYPTEEPDGFAEMDLRPELLSALAGLGLRRADPHPARGDSGDPGWAGPARPSSDRHRQDGCLRSAGVAADDA